MSVFICKYVILIFTSQFSLEINFKTIVNELPRRIGNMVRYEDHKEGFTI